jgi:uncharacterized protein YuzB (UPF0349 family)
MADTRAFNVYFANRTVLPGGVPIADDEALILRGGTVYRMEAANVFAYTSMIDNSDVTDIVTQDVWALIAGTLVEGDASENFSFAANQYTFNGVNQAAPSFLTAQMSLTSASAPVSIYEIGLFVNGTQEGTGMRRGSTQSSPGFFSTTSPHALQNGDVIDMRVRNLSGTDDLTVIDAQLFIK